MQDLSEHSVGQIPAQKNLRARLMKESRVPPARCASVVGECFEALQGCREVFIKEAGQ